MTSLPILGKAGCNASSCHSKPDGQNGFKLSVFAYDPESDYSEIVNERGGRRLSPSAPDQSVLLQKATLTIPHEGGKRFEVGSPFYEVIVQWIREGAPYQQDDDAELLGIRLGEEDLVVEKGSERQLRVFAQYSNDRKREVTPLAEFSSNKEALAEVDDHGSVQIRELSGEAVLSARFMGHVATARLTIPHESTLPAEQYAKLPRVNFIDTHAYARFQKLGLFPSAPCSDSDFLRRVSLDLVGQQPTAKEARDFLQDADPDKRTKLVAALLERPGYADHWAVKWADLFRPNPDRAGVKSVYLLDQWLREAFRRNMPYDDFARAILTAQGSTHRHGPAVVYRDRREPEDLTTMFSQVFLGVRLECAKCHHHPNEKWSQEDFYQMAAYFGQVKRKGNGVSPPISGGWEVVYHGGKGKVIHPVSGEVMKPKAPNGPEGNFQDGEDPRHAFASWLTDPSNPFFARAVVNRVWAELMGRGLVDPVDDFRLTNPPTNPALLDALAQDFVAGEYDLKKLLRTITASNVYQQSATPNAHNLSDTENFSRAYKRRLPAEVLADAVGDITQVPDVFQGLPEASRANQVWNFKIGSDFLDAFGRPDSSSDCPCERNMSSSVVQALHLMNSQNLQKKLSDDRGLVHQLASSEHTEERIIEELYLAVYTRLPDDEERALALRAYEQAEATRQTGTEDLLWALLNSAEFVYNH